MSRALLWAFIACGIALLAVGLFANPSCKVPDDNWRELRLIGGRLCQVSP